MILKNNLAAQISLGELNKNISKLGETLAKVVSGMKINSAQDDSAMFAISEVMRVKIRALSQAMQNVQNGNSLLRVAEDGIQQQIDLVRTIKEKVINAANDHNSDIDRKILQKEVNQFYDQIEQTAYYTDYNSHKPLIWQKRDVVLETKTDYEYGIKDIVAYIANDTATFNADSVMDVIADVYEDDGKVGNSFDTFENFNGEYQSFISNFNSTNPLGTESKITFEPGDDAGKAAKMEFDFASIDLASLKTFDGGTGITINGFNSDAADSNSFTSYSFVLTKKTFGNTERLANSLPSSLFSVNTISTGLSGFTSDQIINISNMNDPSDLVAEIAKRLKALDGSRADNQKCFSDVDTDGTKLVLTSANKTKLSEQMSVGNFSKSERYYKYYPAASISGTSSVTLSPAKIKGYSPDTGTPIYETPYPSGTINVTVSNSPCGLYDNYYGLQLITGDSYSRTYSNSNTNSRTFSVSGIALYSNYNASKDNYDIHYNPVQQFKSSSVTSSIIEEGENPQSAHVDINLSQYKNDVEGLINAFTGKAFQYNYCYNPEKKYMSSNGCYYEFYDSASEMTDKDVLFKGNYNYLNYQTSSNFNALDLNLVRQDVKDGKNVIQSFAERLQKIYNETIYNYDSVSQQYRYETYCDLSFLDSEGNEFKQSDVAKNPSLLNNIETVRINSRYKGSRGNDDNLQVYSADFSHYDINFNIWFENNPSAKIPDDLDGKGFRYYCSTDPDEWFNIVFRSNVGDVPPSLPGIKTVEVDVSKVTDAKSLVDSIYQQAQPKITGQVPGFENYNHYFNFAKTSEETDTGFVVKDGWLTVYDRRPFNLATDYYTSNVYQVTSNGAKGAKIADGVYDNIEQIVDTLPTTDTVITNLSAAIGDPYKKFVIQDTDKADMHLVVRVPDTRLDSIFNIAGIEIDDSYEEISDYTAVKDSLGNIVGFTRTITRGKVIDNADKKSIRQFSLNSKADRDALLGNDKVYPPVKGILDQGLEYLLDAAVLVGAQRERLESDGLNLVTQVENEMFSESTIRDADMAKEMAEYTKFNVLSQSAQAMLAQANQNSSAVLNLLQ